MKTKYLSIPLLLIFGFVAFLPNAEAVVPPPDGGYSGFTTAEGTNALKNLTVEELKEEIRRLTETVKVEASEIKKVTARLQMVDPATTRPAVESR
jgi:hypothetical protein